MIISCLHLYMYIFIMMIVCPYSLLAICKEDRISSSSHCLISDNVDIQSCRYLLQHPACIYLCYVRISLDQFLWFVEHPEVIGYWIRDSIPKCTIIRKVKSEDKWKENTQNCQISKLIGTCSQNCKTTFYIFFTPSIFFCILS